MKPITLLLLLLTIIAGCKRGSNDTFSIRDFSPKLQPYLTVIVNNGLVGDDTTTRYLQAHATDDELQKLSFSEHPILRAIVLRAMLTRNTFNHYRIVMQHLYDTAIVPVDFGEWGIRYFKVADDMLVHSRWKDSTTKNLVVEEIVLKHNKLMQAYYKASYLPVDEKYYTSIKQMTLRKRNDELINDINFKVMEEAFYALARYKKALDIPFIKSVLEDNAYQLSDASFGLMSQYPDSSYLSVYEKYYRYYFYSDICDNWGHSVDKACSFISSLAIYKSERSAKILTAILNKKPFVPCRCGVSTLERTLAHAIADNMCEAYKGMVEKANKILEDERKNTSIILSDQSFDTIKYPKLEEPIRW